MSKPIVYWVKLKYGAEFIAHGRVEKERSKEPGDVQVSLSDEEYIPMTPQLAEIVISRGLGFLAEVEDVLHD